MRRRARWLAVVAILVWAGACAKPAPVVVAEPPPPLEIPVPPPRVLAPVIVPEAPAPPVAPTPEPPRPSRPRPARPAGADARPDPARPDAGLEGPPADAARSAPEPPAPPLRTPTTANDAEADKRVRDVLARATRGLEGVNRAQLSSDARAQFDTARRFIDQASDALKARNFMFAAYLADKAETLARGLAGR